MCFSVILALTGIVNQKWNSHSELLDEELKETDCTPPS